MEDVPFRSVVKWGQLRGVFESAFCLCEEVCVSCSGNVPRADLLMWECEIVPGVRVRSLTSVFLSMLYHAEPTGAILFSSLCLCITHTHTHKSTDVHTRSAFGHHPQRLQFLQLSHKVFSHCRAPTCSHTPMTHIASLHTGLLSVSQNSLKLRPTCPTSPTDHLDPKIYKPFLLFQQGKKNVFVRKGNLHFWFF